MRRESVINKSAGKSRKVSVVPLAMSSSERPSKVSLLMQQSMPLLLASINDASEEERAHQYDHFNPSGEFERDFVLLCYLVGLKVTISHRQKVPSSPHSPNTVNINEKKSLSSTLSQEKIIDTGNSLPTTYVLSTNKYEYFKPNIEIVTEFDLNKEHVKDLYLRGWKADMRIINVFSKILPGLERLTVLNMWNAGLVDETLYCLGQCLTLTPSLKTLCLDGNNFVAGQRFHVFLEQPDKLSLQHLSLRNCNINEVGALNLANTLSENKNLLTLNLCFNKLGNLGMYHLAKALRLNRTLLSLNIGSNEIGDEGVKYIADVISTFPLTHEEVVTRRIQQSLLTEELIETPPLQEGTVHTSQHASGKHSRDKTSKKKDGKGKDKRSKSSWDKAVKAQKTNGVPKTERIKSPQTEDDPYDFKNPLLEKARLINGELWIPGNRSLINLNLSRNMISKVGVESLHTAIKYQVDLALERKRTAGTGLMKLSLQKNFFSVEDVTYAAVIGLLKSRDPLSNPHDTTSVENI